MGRLWSMEHNLAPSGGTECVKLYVAKLYEILASNIVVATVLIDCPSPVVGVL